MDKAGRLICDGVKYTFPKAASFIYFGAEVEEIFRGQQKRWANFTSKRKLKIPSALLDKVVCIGGGLDRNGLFIGGGGCFAHLLGEPDKIHALGRFAKYLHRLCIARQRVFNRRDALNGFCKQIFGAEVGKVF